MALPHSPPYLSPSFETIEARLWATDTINNVFSKPTDFELSPPTPEVHEGYLFDTNKYFLTRSGTLMDMEAVYTNTTLIPYKSQRESRRNTILSLSSSLSSSSISSFNEHQHTPINNRHSSFISSLLSKHSDPVTTTNDHQRPQSSVTDTTKMISRRSTLTRHLKRHWTIDDSTTSGVRRLFTSQQQQKERKAHTMWREKLHEYLIDAAFQLPAPRQGMVSPRLAYCIVSEMLATEETYLGHLTAFKQLFIDPFLKTFQHRYMIRDIHTIFTHIPQLITLSTTLTRRWCQSIEQQNYYMDDRTTVEGIGKTFCDLEDEFKVYTYYAVHYAKAQKCVTRMEQKPIYRQWMHAVLQKKEVKRMGLKDYLISPIQRITRYCLLVKNLIKHSSGHHAALERALKYLTALAVTMNDCQQ